MTEQLATIDKKTLSVLTKLKNVELKYQKLTEQRDLLKEQLKVTMERNDIKKFENDDISITYVDATTTNRFDSTKFKRDHPETYELYQAPSITKAHVRFKLK